MALNSKILTKDEIVTIIQHFNSVSISHLGFQGTKRSVYSGEMQRCCRFASLTDDGLRYVDRRDAINFFIDKDF